MRSIISNLMWATALTTLMGQTPAPIKTGPDVGSPVPVFSAPDQQGVVQTSQSILGPNGALLVFFRSADW